VAQVSDGTTDILHNVTVDLQTRDITIDQSCSFVRNMQNAKRHRASAFDMPDALWALVMRFLGIQHRTMASVSQRFRSISMKPSALLGIITVRKEWKSLPAGLQSLNEQCFLSTSKAGFHIDSAEVSVLDHPDLCVRHLVAGHTKLPKPPSTFGGWPVDTLETHSHQPDDLNRVFSWLAHGGTTVQHVFMAHYEPQNKIDSIIYKMPNVTHANLFLIEHVDASRLMQGWPKLRNLELRVQATAATFRDQVAPQELPLKHLTIHITDKLDLKNITKWLVHFPNIHLAMFFARPDVLPSQPCGYTFRIVAIQQIGPQQTDRVSAFLASHKSIQSLMLVGAQQMAGDLSLDLSSLDHLQELTLRKMTIHAIKLPESVRQIHMDHTSMDAKALAPLKRLERVRLDGDKMPARPVLSHLTSTALEILWLPLHATDEYVEQLVRFPRLSVVTFVGCRPNQCMCVNLLNHHLSRACVSKSLPRARRLQLNALDQTESILLS